MLVVCSSAWQNESGKSGVKKGTVSRAGPEASWPLVGERPVWFCSFDDCTASNIVFCGKVFISAIAMVLVKDESLFRKAAASGVRTFHCIQGGKIQKL